jgi:hypothetical protein
MKNLILILTFIPFLVFAQNFIYEGSVGKFNYTSSFYITANGLIYVTDLGDNEIVSIDTLGNKIKSFGGYGWSENSFDHPVDVFANPLTVYVADKNNHRIKRFDKNLNFISSLYTRDSDNSAERFGYPLGCATSNQGDLYVTDSEDERIIKFNNFGNFEQNFGGLDAGKYVLNNPTQLAISSNNNVFVIDDSVIVVFDQFGNGIKKIHFDFPLNSIRILFDKLIVTSIDKILYLDLNLTYEEFSELNLIGLDEKPEIISAILFGNNLYVLTPYSILVFKEAGKF